MVKYRITDGQSIFDVALQNYGDNASVIRILKDNFTLLGGINNTNIANVTIDVDDERNNFADNLLLKKRIVNTSDPKIKLDAAFSNGYNEAFKI